MPTLSEVEEMIEKWCERLLFAQKVNTVVTGIGLVGIAIAILTMTYVISIQHDIEMRQLQGMEVIKEDK